MSERERMKKLLDADPVTLAKVDALLDGKLDNAARADDDIRLVTYTEAAKRLNISRPTVYRLAKLGRLELVTLNGVNRIRLKSIVDFANGSVGSCLGETGAKDNK